MVRPEPIPIKARPSTMEAKDGATAQIKDPRICRAKAVCRMLGAPSRSSSSPAGMSTMDRARP